MSTARLKVNMINIQCYVKFYIKHLVKETLIGLSMCHQRIWPKELLEYKEIFCSVFGGGSLKFSLYTYIDLPINLEVS